METWLLLLLGFGFISIVCTLLILGACIVSNKAERARENARLAREQMNKDSASQLERVRTMWRRA
jgi:Na+-transporting methylmalonyl-CoA/oxaloacetate decarboxylase gamma subunit